MGPRGPRATVLPHAGSCERLTAKSNAELGSGLEIDNTKGSLVYFFFLFSISLCVCDLFLETGFLCGAVGSTRHLLAV